MPARHYAAAQASEEAQSQKQHSAHGMEMVFSFSVVAPHLDAVPQHRQGLEPRTDDGSFMQAISLGD
jgi:hypothetical protein